MPHGVDSLHHHHDDHNHNDYDHHQYDNQYHDKYHHKYHHHDNNNDHHHYQYYHDDCRLRWNVYLRMRRKRKQLELGDRQLHRWNSELRLHSPGHTSLHSVRPYGHKLH